MIDDGFIHLYRSMLTTSFARKPNLVAAWVHCLLLASWKEYDTMIGMTQVRLKPGQFITGRKRFAEETGLSENIVRNAFSHFSNQGMIKVYTSQGQAASIVTIVNWETYQKIGQPNNQGSTKVQPSKNQAITKPSPLIEEIKEVITPIEDKSSISPTVDGIDSEPQENHKQEEPNTTIHEKTSQKPLVDSEAPKPSGCSLEDQSLNQEPSGRKKKAIPNDVKTVMDAYRDKVKFIDKTRTRSKEWITRLLKHETIDTLLQSIDNYLLACEADGTEEKFRRGVGNFFGKDREWEDYLDDELMEGIEGEAKRKKFRDAIGVDIPIQNDDDLEALEAKAAMDLPKHKEAIHEFAE